MNKYIEFALQDTYEDYVAKDKIFRALKLGVGGIALPPFFLYLAELIPDGYIVSTYVDYPYGHENTQLRQHAIISAANRGARSVDVVCPHFYLLNKKYDKFEADIDACMQASVSKGISLRLMLDYRLIQDAKDLNAVCKIIRKIGVEYVFPSVGHFVDDFWDNLIIAQHIQQEFELSTIANGNIYTTDHFDSMRKTDIFGIRFNNITALERFMVYKTIED